MLSPGGFAWLYLISLPVSGLFALRYWVTYRAYWAGRFGGGDGTDELQRLRTELMRLLPESW
jgi:hypothetical protein